MPRIRLRDKFLKTFLGSVPFSGHMESLSNIFINVVAVQCNNRKKDKKLRRKNRH